MQHPVPLVDLSPSGRECFGSEVARPGALPEPRFGVRREQRRGQEDLVLRAVLQADQDAVTVELAEVRVGQLGAPVGTANDE
jgi:hypothetical protein